MLNIFLGCSSLIDVEIPDSVTLINDDAFGGCSSLQHIEVPTSVISIGDNCFAYCSSLSEVYLPGSVETIGCESFANCNGLEALILPQSIKVIGEKAFKDCSSLKYLEIPDSVKEIKHSAFSGCCALEDIYCLSTDIENAIKYHRIFEGVNTYKCKLHIPVGTKWSYKYDFLFGQFKDVETFSPLTGNVIYKKENIYLNEKGKSASLEQIADYLIDKLNLDKEDGNLFRSIYVGNDGSAILCRTDLKNHRKLERLEMEGLDIKHIIKLIDELPDKGNGTCTLPVNYNK